MELTEVVNLLKVGAVIAAVWCTVYVALKEIKENSSTGYQPRRKKTDLK